MGRCLIDFLKSLTSMSKWFVPEDTLNIQGETYITESMTEDYIIKMILKDIDVL